MSISKDLRIEIRPVPNRNNIKNFSSNLEYFSKSTIISAFVNPVTLKYETGLTEEDVQYLKDNGFPYDISNHWTKNVAHPFWESDVAKTELKSTPTFLHPGKNLVDFVKYKYLLKNKYIYSSEEEMMTGSKPEATHFIFNEEVATEVKAIEIEENNTILGKLSKLSNEKKKSILLIILNEDMTNKADSYLTVKFDEIMQLKELKQHLLELLSEDPKEVAMLATVKMAMFKAVLRKTKQGIFFFDNNLGYSEKDVAKFLGDAENQEILLTIKSKI